AIPTSLPAIAWAAILRSCAVSISMAGRTHRAILPSTRRPRSSSTQRVTEPWWDRARFTLCRRRAHPRSASPIRLLPTTTSACTASIPQALSTWAIGAAKVASLIQSLPMPEYLAPPNPEAQSIRVAPTRGFVAAPTFARFLPKGGNLNQQSLLPPQNPPRLAILLKPRPLFRLLGNSFSDFIRLITLTGNTYHAFSGTT